MRTAAAGRLLQPRKTDISRVNLAQVVAQFLQKYLATLVCLVRRDARIVRYPGGVSMGQNRLPLFEGLRDEFTALGQHWFGDRN